VFLLVVFFLFSLSSQGMSRAVVTVDAVSKSIIAASFGAVNLFGYSLGELIGRNVSMLMPAGYAKQHDSYIERFLASGIPHVIDKSRFVAGRRKDGKLINLKLSLSMMKIEGSVLFVGLLELVESRSCKIEADKKGKITACSSNVRGFFGHNKGELIGQNVSTLCSEPHRSQHDRYIEEYHVTGRSRVLNKARNVNALHANGFEFSISLQVRLSHHGFKARIYPLENVDVMVTVDASNKVKSVTEKCRILFGRLEDELIDQDMDSLFRDVKPSAMPLETVFEAEMIALDGAVVKVKAFQENTHASERVS
jgi:PAS domain S-box-containing protein